MRLSSFFALFCLIVESGFGYEIDFPNGDESSFHYVPIAHSKWAISFLGKDIAKNSFQTNLSIRVNEFNHYGPSVFTFEENGRLKKFFRDTDDRTACTNDYALLTFKLTKGQKAAKQLWRRQKNVSDEIKQKWWKGNGRLTLFYFNPNGAGLLFAELALLLLYFATYIAKKNKFRVCLLLLSVLSLVLLFLTESRGGMVAFFLALALLMLGRTSEKRQKFVIAFMFFIAVMFFVLYVIFGTSCCTQFVDGDKGNVQRLCAWDAVPRMMAAGVSGWSDQCGQDYGNWFQDENDLHPLMYLVNTHFTWMVSKGVVFAWVYCSGWILLFLTLSYVCVSKYRPLALSLWALFFIANWFSTLGIFYSLWVLPILSLVVSSVGIYKYMRENKFPFAMIFCASAIVGMGIVGLMCYFGNKRMSTIDVPVKRTSHITFVGSGNPVVYIVPDIWALSHFNYGSIGRDVRKWCKEHRGAGTLAIADALCDVPESVQRLVLVGNTAEEYVKRIKQKTDNACRAERVIFLSPNFSSNILKDAFFERKNAEIYTGEYLAEMLETKERKWVHRVPGCELYLTNWVDVAFSNPVQK